MSVLNPENVRGNAESGDWTLCTISAHLEKPIVSFDDGLCLDGPLQWAAYQLHDDKENLPDPDHEWCVDFEIPIARWQFEPPEGEQPLSELDDRALSASGNLRGWCVSNVQAEWVLRDKTHVRKVEPSDYMKRWSDKSRVNVRSGQYKGANKPYPIKYAPVLRWVCLCDPDRVQKYLNQITHLGKLTNHGWGKLQSSLDGTPSWSIERYGDGSWWRVGEKITAQVPYGFCGCEQKSPQMMAMRAPRWDHRRHAMMMPGENIRQGGTP